MTPVGRLPHEDQWCVMAVRCSHCGEELMGAVNRCWKCGRAFSAQPATDGLPPVRRVPVAAVSAEAINESSDAVVKAEVATELVAAKADKPIRSGSPFSLAAIPASHSAQAIQPAPLVPLSALPLPTALNQSDADRITSRPAGPSAESHSAPSHSCWRPFARKLPWWP